MDKRNGRKRKRTLKDFTVTEISIVDVPAQDHANITITKNFEGDSEMEKDKEVEKKDAPEAKDEEVKKETSETETKDVEKKDEKVEKKETKESEEKVEKKDSATDEGVSKSDFEAVQKKADELEKRLEDERIEKRANGEFADVKADLETRKAFVKAIEGMDEKVAKKAEEFLKNTAKVSREFVGTSVSKIEADSPAGELETAIQKSMTDNKIDYQTALNKVVNENPALAQGLGI